MHRVGQPTAGPSLGRRPTRWVHETSPGGPKHGRRRPTGRPVHLEDLGLVRAPDRVEQLIAAEDPAVGLEERLEEAELDMGQDDEVAADPDLVPRRVRRRGRCGASGPRQDGRPPR